MKAENEKGCLLISQALASNHSRLGAYEGVRHREARTQKVNPSLRINYVPTDSLDTTTPCSEPHKLELFGSGARHDNLRTQSAMSGCKQNRRRATCSPLNPSLQLTHGVSRLGAYEGLRHREARTQKVNPSLRINYVPTDSLDTTTPCSEPHKLELFGSGARHDNLRTQSAMSGCKQNRRRATCSPLNPSLQLTHGVSRLCLES